MLRHLTHYLEGVLDKVDPSDEIQGGTHDVEY